jgi:death-on-curing family protein
VSKAYFPDYEDLAWWVNYVKGSSSVLKLSLPITNAAWYDRTLGVIELLRLPYYGNDLHMLAARLFYKVVKDHNYSDGNKRSAIVAVYVFLLLNDYSISPSLDIRKLAKNTAKTKGSKGEERCTRKIYAALLKHSEPLADIEQS